MQDLHTTRLWKYGCRTNFLGEELCLVQLNIKTKDIQSLQTHRQAEIPGGLWKNNSRYCVERTQPVLVFPQSPECLSDLFHSLSASSAFTNLPRSVSPIGYDFSPLVLTQRNNRFLPSSLVDDESVSGLLTKIFLRSRWKWRAIR